MTHHVYQDRRRGVRDFRRDIIHLRIGYSRSLELELNELTSVKLLLYMLD